MEIAKVTSKGQVTIPKAVRDDLGLVSGDKVVWIKSGKRWEVLNPIPIRSFSSDELAKSDQLKEKLIAETAAKYDLDADEIRSRIRTTPPDQLIADVQEAFAGLAEEEGWETEEDIANYIYRQRSSDPE